MTPSINETRTQRAFFRGSPRYGRTTQLIDRRTGEVLTELMGVVTRRDAYASYLRQKGAGR